LRGRNAMSANDPKRTLTVVVNWPLHGASQSELRSQPIRCANAEWHLAACHLALPKLSISPMRPQLQEPQTARCVTLVTQARRVGCYRLSLSTPVQVSKAMNRERYRPDAIDGSVVSGTISEGGRWMTRHQIELSRTRECPSLASFSPLYFTFPSFLLFFGPRQRRAPH